MNGPYSTGEEAESLWELLFGKSEGGSSQNAQPPAAQEKEEGK